MTNTAGTGQPWVYVRLSAMMFFQYMMFAVWWVPMAAYLANMGVSRGMMALVLSCTALGSLASPMVGMLADRYFRSQHVLFVSNMVMAAMLLLAGFISGPVLLFVILLVAMLFYMPTGAIVSSIAMTHAPSEMFARIRVWGTIGWIMAGVFSMVSLTWLGRDFDGTNLPFFAGSGLALLTAIINLTLPDTPPPGRGQKATLMDVMGFRSLVLLKDRNFRIFLILFFLSVIPFSMYWFYFSEYLHSTGYKLITVTMSVGQMTEIFILLMVPWVIRKYGLRTTILMGMVALVLRYLAFYLAGEQASLPWVMTGVAVHGIIFGFLHLGAQIYTDKKAPPALKAQAQGLTFFVSLGLGMLAGNFICGWIIRIFSTTVADTTLYNWNPIWGIMALISFVVLLGFIILFREEDYQSISID